MNDVEEKTYNIELTSSECSDIIMMLFELIEYHKVNNQDDNQNINDLVQKIKTQFFEQGNVE